MNIHFCSLCNESVPQADLDLGRAFVRRGRVICAVCERAMTHETGSSAHGTAETRDSGGMGDGQTAAATAAPALLETAQARGARPDTVSSPVGTEPALPPPALIPASGDAPAATGSSSGLVLAMVALIFAAGAVAVLNEQIRDLGNRETAYEAAQRRQGQTLDELERGNRAARESLAALTSDLERRLEGEREGRDVALGSMRVQAE